MCASATPCWWALAKVPDFALVLEITGSLPWRGKRGLHGACGPTSIGSSFQPLRSWVLTQVAVRLGCLMQARDAPEM